MPLYQRASSTGDSVTLQNDCLRAVFYKRLSGWGFAELYTPCGKLMAVLDHLGEIKLRDFDIPLRMEAGSYAVEDGGRRLVFPVASQNIPKMLAGSSFDNWMRFPFDAACLDGTVTATLAPDKPLLRLEYRFRAAQNVYASYIKGPWLRVGEASFGADKHDAVFPGVEWNVGREWSSGQDWFKDPWAMKCIPHPNKVSIPMMAVSHGGWAVGMSWEADARATRWFNYREMRAQPVFASPNFIERLDNHLMGLKLPDAEVDAQENRLESPDALELHLDQRIAFTADVFLYRGNGADAVARHVAERGLPDPGRPRWEYGEALTRMAAAYDVRFFTEGKGFGIPQNFGSRSGPQPEYPAFLRRYVEENAGTALAESLRRKLDWCDAHRAEPAAPDPAARGREILSWQRADGAFCFEPDGRHYKKDDFVVARMFHEPMGQAGDTAVDFCALAALELLDLAPGAGQKDAADFRAGAVRTLDFCMGMERPEGGDFWETPLHAPNLLAAGHAAIAYMEAARQLDRPDYRARAVYWIRTLLPFTHLWEPKGKPMLYNTKPCLCSSDWYFANWVRDHVQWEVLAVFEDSAKRGIDWAGEDDLIDWRTYQRGVTQAAMRWMVDHREQTWLPHNLPDTYEAYMRGEFDDCYPDTHNSVTGNYGGMFIPPAVIAANLYALMDCDSGK